MAGFLYFLLADRVSFLLRPWAGNGENIYIWREFFDNMECNVIIVIGNQAAHNFTWMQNRDDIYLRK